MLLTSIVPNLPRFKIQMSQLQVDDVLMGRYVDNAPRYYKVLRVTPKKVKVLRLKHRFAEDGTDLGPGTTTYGKELIMTKKDEVSATHYGMVVTRM